VGEGVWVWERLINAKARFEPFMPLDLALKISFTSDQPTHWGTKYGVNVLFSAGAALSGSSGIESTDGGKIPDWPSI